MAVAKRPKRSGVAAPSHDARASPPTAASEPKLKIDSLEEVYPYDLSTVDGRRFTGQAIERSNLPEKARDALISALNDGRFPTRGRGRLTDSIAKRVSKELNAWFAAAAKSKVPHGTKKAVVGKLAKEKHITVDAMRDRIERPNRKRTKKR